MSPPCPRLHLLLLLLLACLAGLPARASGSADPVSLPDPDAPRGLFVGEDWRYGQRGVIPRAFADLLAIPSGAPFWRPRGWLGAASVMVPVGILMAPMHPSPDARLDQWTRVHTDPVVPKIWVLPMQVGLFGGIFVGGFGTWGAAAAFDWPVVAQGMSLTLESAGVAQLTHLYMKLLIGREGPGDGDGLGIILGPSASLGLFPAGTPSGHAATLFAILGSTQAFFQPPLPVAIGTHAVVGGLIVMHVLNHGHFISDSLWGSAMGYAIGVWVVQHRSSHFAYRQGRPQRLEALGLRRAGPSLHLAPWVPQGQGTGLLLGGSF